MAFVIYGTKSISVGYDEQLVYCQSCESDTFSDLLIRSTYYHMYYIPMFPISKEVSITCQKCGLKSYDLPFDSRVIKNYDEIKGEFKHPWYSWVFLGSIGFLILLAIIL